MTLKLPDSRNKRLILLSVVVGLIFGIAAIIRLTSQPSTAGDSAAKDSSAFLVYDKQTYRPTKNNHTDELIRKDLAYFARKSLPVYDPDEHPGVVFNVSKIMPGASGETVLAGRFELSKDKIEIRFSKAPNERIKNSITNLKTKTTMDTQLPSSSKFNQLIKKLPINQGDYLIEYIARDGSISVTLGDANPKDLLNAKTYIADSSGISLAELEKYPVGYTFPTNFDENEPSEGSHHD